ncbi:MULTISPECIES: hypothetical protein [unclassified Caballeronia]|uniref:hypothetical protein n=1 Tax=unclassified Caballeronia TaxID=2646786 RepID=UPI002028FF2F|nr:MULTISPECIES: hypothetical protein [unclassified Caballeronia]
MTTDPRLAKLRATATGFLLCAVLAGCNGRHDDMPAAADDVPVLSVPLKRDGHWLLEARSADGKSVRVLLDTGATLNVLDSRGRLAAVPMTPAAEAVFLRNGLLSEPVGDRAVTSGTASDTMRMELGTSPAIRLDGWSMAAGGPVLIGDMARLSSVDERPFDGIIGMESMRNLTWRADYVAGRLSAYAGEAPAHAWQQCAFMTLDAAQRTPLIELRLRDESLPFLLDTGDNGDVALPQETFDAIAEAQWFERINTTFSYDATDRFTPNQQGLIAGFAIGQKALPKLTVLAGSPTPRIGQGLLEKMDRFEMDFRHYRFCFDLPDTPKDSTPSIIGAGLQRAGDRYRVAALAPDGRLAASGIEIGDRVVMVERTSVATLKFVRLLELLNAAATGEVTIERGKRTLVIKLKAI